MTHYSLQDCPLFKPVSHNSCCSVTKTIVNSHYRRSSLTTKRKQGEFVYSSIFSIFIYFSILQSSSSTDAQIHRERLHTQLHHTKSLKKANKWNTVAQWLLSIFNLSVDSWQEEQWDRRAQSSAQAATATGGSQEKETGGKMWDGSTIIMMVL